MEIKKKRRRKEEAEMASGKGERQRERESDKRPVAKRQDLYQQAPCLQVVLGGEET
jgi:hypothetical protein